MTNCGNRLWFGPAQYHVPAIMARTRDCHKRWHSRSCCLMPRMISNARAAVVHGSRVKLDRLVTNRTTNVGVDRVGMRHVPCIFRQTYVTGRECPAYSFHIYSPN